MLALDAKFMGGAHVHEHMRKAVCLAGDDVQIQCLAQGQHFRVVVGYFGTLVVFIYFLHHQQAYRSMQALFNPLWYRISCLSATYIYKLE